MEVSIRYEMKGECIRQGDSSRFSPASYSTVLSEGKPYLEVNLNYLETTPETDIQSIKDLLK